MPLFIYLLTSDPDVTGGVADHGEVGPDPDQTMQKNGSGSGRQEKLDLDPTLLKNHGSYLLKFTLIFYNLFQCFIINLVDAFLKKRSVLAGF